MGKKFHMRLHSLVCIYLLIKTQNKITIEKRLIKATQWYIMTFVMGEEMHPTFSVPISPLPIQLQPTILRQDQY
jgi:hypothetical protein